MNDELTSIRKELRFLKAYALLSTALFMILWFSGFKHSGETQHFEEIDVERINIVEKDGQLRMVISNRERQHHGSVDGKTLRRPNGRPPGIIFFNHVGDECGGLVFDENGGKGHFVSMTFDKTRNDQTVGLQHLEGDNGKYFAGLRIWERPNTSIADLDSVMDIIQNMPDGPTKTAARQELRDKGEFGADRIMVARLRDKSAVIGLADPKGKIRLQLVVDSLGAARVEFLDEAGKVVHAIPE